MKAAIASFAAVLTIANIQLAAQHHLPAIYGLRHFAKSGSLISLRA